MLLNLDNLKQKYDLKIKGVLHIGAHVGQEFGTYQRLGIDNVMFFEPVPSTFQRLKENVGDKAILVNTALGNMIGEVEMFTETVNQGQSSSVLEPEHHLVQHPNIQFNGRQNVAITKLDTFIEDKDKYNFINIDVQGYELEVFKGGAEYLKTIDYVMTEVNRAELYKGCARIEELDAFLGGYGFERVETTWDGGTWGDAFYVKR
ncbi:MAG: FkbM family methyltransferase [Spirochaetes bacterium]|nr:MAG: FkbM family methyltransferase [Spirochaetota bacterium]